MLKYILILNLYFYSSYCSYCGPYSVPTGLEVTLRGSLILECARSPCLGISPTHEDSVQGSSFYGDGYLRYDTFPPQANPVNAEVTCQPEFLSTSCNPESQWTGGIIPGVGITNGSFQVACCNYGPLQFSRSVGVATIKNGQIYHGGDSNPPGELPSYDYVANVEPVTDPDGSKTYYAYIRRLTCLPRNPPPSLNAGLQSSPMHIIPAQPPSQPVVQSGAPTYYYPVPAAGGGPTFQCFSGDSTVELPSGAKKQLKNLKIGDWVNAYGDDKLVLSKVDSWIHRKIEDEAAFLHIHLENGRSIKITKNHLIYKSSCDDIDDERIDKNKVYAEELNVGDCLIVKKELKYKIEKSKIISIDTVVEKGYYSPKTLTGNMFINGIFVNCYSNLDNQELHFTYSMIKELMSYEWIKNIFGYIKKDTFDSNTFDEIELVPGVETLLVLSQYALGYYK